MGNKKSFLGDNPALQFISDINKEPDAPLEQPKSNKALNKGNNIETKSAHVHLLIKPSTLVKLKKIAQEEQLSVNELINQTLEQRTLEVK